MRDLLDGFNAGTAAARPLVEAAMRKRELRAIAQREKARLRMAQEQAQASRLLQRELADQASKDRALARLEDRRQASLTRASLENRDAAEMGFKERVQSFREREADETVFDDIGRAAAKNARDVQRIDKRLGEIDLMGRQLDLTPEFSERLQAERDELLAERTGKMTARAYAAASAQTSLANGDPIAGASMFEPRRRFPLQQTRNTNPLTGATETTGSFDPENGTISTFGGGGSPAPAPAPQPTPQTTNPNPPGSLGPGGQVTFDPALVDGIANNFFRSPIPPLDPNDPANKVTLPAPPPKKGDPERFQFGAPF